MSEHRSEAEERSAMWQCRIGIAADEGGG